VRLICSLGKTGTSQDRNAWSIDNASLADWKGQKGRGKRQAFPSFFNAIFIS
jgi:hypothetical protein